MNDKQTTRRRFLVAALTFSGVASGSLGISFLRSSAAWAAATDDADNLAVMGRLAQLLFPHDGLADSVYGEVIGEVLATTAADPATDGLLAVAEEALDAAQDQAWIDLPESEQLEAMIALQNEAFFAGIRETVRFHLYYHPGLWQHIGYPGSSKEHGGYKFRGFDDIDWLPETE
ncbi:MAG: hypothetical protein OES10_08210 [Gammaproteobacteria bacterium]|jgi:hypothetical protein|nr:hypothetical protein [Gammaproteobacteria bacterium]